MLKVGNVKVQIDELRPLERVVRLKQIDIDAPHVVAARNAAGRVNLLLAAEGTGGTAMPVARVPLPTASSAAMRAASATSAASGAGASAAASPPWRVSVAALALHAGRLDWSDLTTSPAAALALADFSLNAEKIAWPLAAPVVFRGDGLLGSGAERGKLVVLGPGRHRRRRRSRWRWPRCRSRPCGPTCAASSCRRSPAS